MTAGLQVGQNYIIKTCCYLTVSVRIYYKLNKTKLMYLILDQNESKYI